MSDDGGMRSALRNPRFLRFYLAQASSQLGDAIAWIATRPSHVDIDELVIKPRAQAAAHKVHRTRGCRLPGCARIPT